MRHPRKTVLQNSFLENELKKHLQLNISTEESGNMITYIFLFLIFINQFLSPPSLQTLTHKHKHTHEYYKPSLSRWGWGMTAENLYLFGTFSGIFHCYTSLNDV